MEENFIDIPLNKLLGIEENYLYLKEKEQFKIEKLELESESELDLKKEKKQNIFIKSEKIDSIQQEINELYNREIIHNGYIDRLYSSREIIHYRYKKKYHNSNVEKDIAKLTRNNFNFKSRKEILGEK